MVKHSLFIILIIKWMQLSKIMGILRIKLQTLMEMMLLPYKGEQLIDVAGDINKVDKVGQLMELKNDIRS